MKRSWFRDSSVSTVTTQRTKDREI